MWSAGVSQSLSERAIEATEDTHKRSLLETSKERTASLIIDDPLVNLTFSNPHIF